MVARAEDAETRAVVAEVEREADLLTLAIVDRPGVVAAMETGVRYTHGDIVALTDDDARPHRDWLARILAAFEQDQRIAGVGGRDDVGGHVLASKRTVGRLGWFGRLVGNHHLGTGPPRDVTVLKGVNCAYRREVLERIGFDHRLRGRGAQMHWEVALGLAVTRTRGRLLYDPAIMVDHDEAPRVNGQRLWSQDVLPQFLADAAYNETLVLSEHLAGPRRLAYVVWSELVGRRYSPGLVQAVRFTPSLRRESWRRWQAAAQARREARRAAGVRG